VSGEPIREQFSRSELEQLIPIVALYKSHINGLADEEEWR
jgi:hypothetical protein